ncbi:hypothetical protein TNCV_2408601 [Trichonephila clavipes]|nr:hypothetical protein TNCV_2408601 [Trichonephila clavipes]
MNYFITKTRGHGTTPPRVKEDIEDVSSELRNGGYRLRFFNETSRALRKIRNIEVRLYFRIAEYDPSLNYERVNKAIERFTYLEMLQ